MKQYSSVIGTKFTANTAPVYVTVTTKCIERSYAFL